MKPLPSSPQEHPKRILVIDDDYPSAMRLASLLDGADYAAQPVQGGSTALDILDQTPFPLVITELHMKDIDGFDIIQHLHDHQPDTSIIAITGHASMESAIQAIHLHVEDFFIKPLDFPSLVKTIKNVFLEIEKNIHRQNLISTIAHDIKAPLTSILGFSQIMIEKNGTLNENLPRYTEIIQSNSRKILHLVENYLLNSRIQEGIIEAVFTPIDIKTILESEIQSLQLDIDRKNITLKLTCDLALKTFFADEHLLSRALANLLGNAVKYSPRGETITVQARENAQKATVEITNKGSFLRPEESQRLFQPFERGHEHHQTPGTGLGLHIVRAIAKAHQGTVHYHSQDGNATFTLCLPTHPHAQQPSQS